MRLSSNGSWGVLAQRQLTSAAARLDCGEMMTLLLAALATRGVLTTWEMLIRPVLSAPGLAGAALPLLNGSVSTALAMVPRPAQAKPARILLACADEELHSLPLETTAAALAESGVDSILLGARVPASALAAAVRRAGPAVVAIWAESPSTANPAQLMLPAHENGLTPLVLAVGPGWDACPLPAYACRPGGLRETLRLLRGPAPTRCIRLSDRAI